ncbi:Integrase core domain-containing protein [Alloyangia pacifica]|uniref:Integrase core domain-containing protein n=1 Tax=Alloyangia pacifica TaxID=311180 RepID=A0A1I6SSJ9_9RHOB|nr:Integrase core domain-containing protein [Alloyangia pacifica]SFS79913.1 Integrase core domain-containing protein [Alloyangia pacifica]
MLDNTLDRQLDVAEPDKVSDETSSAIGPRTMASDITCIRTPEGFAYLAVVIDPLSCRVVAWSMQSRQSTDAVAESFFNLLKRERIRRPAYRTRQEARRDVFDYFEVFCNPKRKPARDACSFRYVNAPMRGTLLRLYFHRPFLSE